MIGFGTRRFLRLLEKLKYLVPGKRSGLENNTPSDCSTVGIQSFQRHASHPPIQKLHTGFANDFPTMSRELGDPKVDRHGFLARSGDDVVGNLIDKPVDSRTDTDCQYDRMRKPGHLLSSSELNQGLTLIDKAFLNPVITETVLAARSSACTTGARNEENEW
jgi:hypothetical protein